MAIFSASCRYRLLIACGVIAMFLHCNFWLVKSCHAGGGPENVMLVVNEDSWASLAIANQYIQLRQIPASNVAYLSGVALGRETVPIEVFREEILLPVSDVIQKRGLEPQIDYIVYSADFPFAIDVRGDLVGDPAAQSLPKYLTKKASINGLTYLKDAVLAGDWKTYLGLNSNLYVTAQGRGFRASYRWNRSGVPVQQQNSTTGQTYMLSTMLAVTSGRGNSLDEVTNYLSRSAAADSTKPSGTIYLMRNSNVRSTTREWAFSRTQNALAQLGVECRIEKGILPKNRTDVMGAVVGSSRIDWPGSRSVILPGAICEHLTSLGGDLRTGRGQSPLSEFLRHGAAGSSGTVTEPYAIQAKFPTSLIHVSYANGCSLAESFYQSVSGPYQLLIVGDPLCQPWAERPLVSATGIKSGQTVSGDVLLATSARDARGIKQLEVYLDGRRKVVFTTNSSYSLDTTQLSNGPHELRVVAVANNPAETQGRLVIPFDVANGERIGSTSVVEQEALSPVVEEQTVESPLMSTEAVVSVTTVKSVDVSPSTTETKTEQPSNAEKSDDPDSSDTTLSITFRGRKHRFAANPRRKLGQIDRCEPVGLQNSVWRQSCRRL